MKNERIIQVFIISIILILIGGFVLPKPETKKLQYRRFWANKVHHKEKYDIVILGDSRAYRGISPSAMQEILNSKSILNFGFSSGRLNKYMFRQTEKKLDLSANNKSVILAITPNALTEHPSENSHINSQLLLPKEEIYQLLNLTSFLHFFSPVQPEAIRKKRSKIKYIESFHDDGWVESYKIPEDTTEAFDEYNKWFTAVDVSEQHINDLLEQTQFWVEQGITVFGFRMPSSYTMEQLEDSLAHFNESILADKFEKSGGIWIETSSNNYHSYDGSHLHKDSAIKFSKHLAEEIKKHFDTQKIEE